MRNLLTRAIAVGVISALPLAAFAGVQPQAANSQPAKTQATTNSQAASKTQPTIHSTSGVVKSIDENSLVLTVKKGKESKERKFTLNSATKKEGSIAAGSHVSVRYENEKGLHVATAVMAKAEKPAATSGHSKGTSKQ